MERPGARMLDREAGILDREAGTEGAGRRDAGNGMSYISKCEIVYYTWDFRFLRTFTENKAIAESKFISQQGERNIYILRLREKYSPCCMAKVTDWQLKSRLNGLSRVRFNAKYELCSVVLVVHAHYLTLAYLHGNSNRNHLFALHISHHSLRYISYIMRNLLYRHISYIAYTRERERESARGREFLVCCSLV